MTNFRRLLEVLADGGVEFILIGGVAAAAYGAVRNTLDLDKDFEAIAEWRSCSSSRRGRSACQP